MYKRFNGTNMSQMNRAAVASVSSAARSYGTSVFSTNITQSQGQSELVVKQYAARLTEEAQAKLKVASNAFTSLGAFTNTSA